MSKSDKVCQVCFDEMHCTSKVGWDPKFDMIIGPGKKMQLCEVRCICTSSMKYPVYFEFDKKMVKSLLNQIIYELEAIGLHVLASICDQAGENQGLANQLGVSIDDNTFVNPYDPTRKVKFSYDLWHGIRNLR